MCSYAFLRFDFGVFTKNYFQYSDPNFYVFFTKMPKSHKTLDFGGFSTFLQKSKFQKIIF